MLSASGPGAIGSSQDLTEPNDTVAQASILGDLSIAPQTQVAGTIGDGPALAADVDWYSFTLDGPTALNLDLQPNGSSHPLDGVLSLYSDDQFDFGDAYDPTGYRLLAQATGGNGSAPQIDRVLSPGTYLVAVSGAGNQYFSPLLAGTGYSGSTGDYNLALSATALNFGPNDGPAVLTSEPAANEVLYASPFVIRLDLSSAIDPATVVAGETVSLTYNPNGTFGDGNDQNVLLAWTNVSSNGTELQLAPNAPLALGYYRVSVAGNSSTNLAVVADLNGNPLGTNADNPQGQDFTESFQVAGIKGRTGASAGSDDTPATAQDLGDITNSGLIQVAAAIGNDPYYDNSDALHNPANDVDLYHFEITGPGRYALVSEVFAGRIGSSLDPGMSLYRVNPDGTLEFVAGNNNTYNPLNGTGGLLAQPLSNDPTLAQGLTAGSYYLAVANGSNVTSPDEGAFVGSIGLLDPNSTHSAESGYTTGPYVLNLVVIATPSRPVVIATTPAQGAVLSLPPTQLTVQFDQPVNILQQAFVSYQETFYCSLPSLFIEGSDGTKFYPRVDSYDPATNQATLLMLDRLAPGSYSLHLSGALGLDGLGGAPLVGNDPSGDFVIHFTVEGTDPISIGDSGTGLQLQAQPGNDGFQDLGVLFPHELQNAITLNYDPASDSAPAAGDETTYQFTLIQHQSYVFIVQGADLPQGAQLLLERLDGTTVPAGHLNNNALLFGEFDPGSYKLLVKGVPPGTAYHIHMAMQGNADLAIPLVTSATPALQLHFDTIVPLGGSAGASDPSGGGTDGRPSTPEDGQSSGGGGTTGPTAGSSSPSGGFSSGSTNTPEPAGGGGFTGVVSGPVTFSPSASPVATNTTTGGSSAQSPLLVTVNVPAGSSSGTSAGPDFGFVGGSTGVAPLGSISTAATGVETQVVNLVSANLVLLGVGPVGGVSPSGSSVAGIQTVQVTLPSPGSSPIPTSLISLVTLTRSGELSDLTAPDEMSAEGLSLGLALVDPATLIPTSPPKLAGPVQDGAESQAQDRAIQKRRLPALTKVEIPGDSVASAPERIASLGSENAGKTGEGVPGVESAAGPDTETSAMAGGPWLLLTTALGAVVLYARRRLARKAAGRFNTSVRPSQGLFRRWGLHLPARTSVTGGMRAMRPSTPSPATPRSNPSPRPRHLTNS